MPAAGDQRDKARLRASPAPVSCNQLPGGNPKEPRCGPEKLVELSKSGASMARRFAKSAASFRFERASAFLSELRIPGEWFVESGTRLSHLRLAALVDKSIERSPRRGRRAVE